MEYSYSFFEQIITYHRKMGFFMVHYMNNKKNKNKNRIFDEKVQRFFEIFGRQFLAVTFDAAVTTV